MTPYRQKLSDLGIELPQVPSPIGMFEPFVLVENLVFLAGQTCELEGTMQYTGKIEVDHDLETGQAAARICALNLLAALELACGGDFDRIDRCVRLGGFVNAPLDYPSVPKVINGASMLMHEVFGEKGKHARTAVGVATLPGRALAEVDAIFRLAS